MIKKRNLLVILFSFIAVSFLSAKSYYVKPESSGQGSGISWSHASSNLQDMINNASAGDTICVAAGIYYGGFILKDGVCMGGGFDGTEKSFIDRQFPGSGQNLTILDGGNKQRVLTQEKGFSSRTVISGFVIQNGYALSGGGAYLFNNAVLEACVICHNTGGTANIGDYIESLGGVVFYTSEGKAHILAVEEYGKNFQSSVVGLKGYHKLENALKDYDGKKNTEALVQSRAAKALSEYKPVTSAGVISDWYIPSIGEWSTLLSPDTLSGALSETGILVNETLKKINRTPIEGNRYWSSTAASTTGLGELWYVNFTSNSINKIHSLQYNKLRGVRRVGANAIKGMGGGLYLNEGAYVISCLVYDNQAPEASAIYLNERTYIYNSTIVNNVAVKKGEYAVGMALGATLSAIKNSLLWNNHDVDNIPLDFVNIPAYNCAARQATTTVDQPVIVLHENNENIAGPNFVNPQNCDFHLLVSSPCAKAGTKSNIPGRYVFRDMDGSNYRDMIDIPVGAYVVATATGVAGPSVNGNRFVIHPLSPVKGEAVEIHFHTAETDLYQIEIVSVDGLSMHRSDFYSNSPLLLSAPYTPGVYLLNISRDGVKIQSAKIIVR
ncbi:MAG: hypothetical protein ACLS4S_05285 [Bacteroides nordii]